MKTFARLAMVKPILTGCCKLPLVADIRMVLVPVGAFAAAAIDKFRPEGPMSCGKAGDTVTPAGREPSFREMVPLKPLSGFAVI